MRPTAVVSNAAFAVPIPLFLGHGLILSGFLTLGALVSSTLYHGSDRRRWRKLDVCAAWALVANNLWLLAASGGRQPFFSLALLLLGVGLLIFYGLESDDWEWHTCSAGITLLCGLAFVTRV